MTKPTSITRLFLWLALPAAILIGIAGTRGAVAGTTAALVVMVALALWLRQRLRADAEAATAGGVPREHELGPVSQAWSAREGQHEGALATLAERQMEMEALLEGMQDGVLAIDAGRNVAWSNAALHRIFEKHGSAVRVGRSLAHTVRDPALLEVLDRSVGSDVPVATRTSGLLPGRVFDVNAAPLRGGGAVVVLRDVTEMEEMQRAQRDFVANVSHELRTPLTSVRGYTETLADSGLVAPEAEPWLEIVLKSVERMSRLTGDLLLLADVDHPDRESHRVTIDAALLVETAVRTFLGQASAEGVTVEQRVSGRALVRVDEIALLQVLGNLLENAARYGKPATGVARTVVLTEPTGHGTVRIAVQDFGPGIATEHHPRIFERFYRVDRARSRATGGTGLGLAIAQRLVKENGGNITLHSSLNEGATFVIELPLADAGL